uniref:MADS-box domain-containing protein n=1 Tax=Leersia perrieri TaxID=77586 RepID=A0A0D9WQN6_9ORYZ
MVAGRTILMRRIEKKESRQTTFSKRGPVVLKMASELSVRTGASVAVVVFSETGRVYAFGTPSSAATSSPQLAGRIKGAIRAGRVHWWDADAEALGLTELVRALERVRDSVRRPSAADVLLSAGGQPKQKPRRRRAQAKHK